MQKYILVLNGPMCAGKSTVTKLIMQRDSVFRGAYDAVKWLISNYSADNEQHKKIAKEVIFSAITKAVESGLSIVIDGGFADYRERYQTLAKEHNFIYLSVNIETSIDTLEKRFLNRVESAKLNDSKTISVTTLEGFHSRYQLYVNHNKDFDGIVLDSGNLTPEQILIEIDKIIETKESN